MKMLGKMNMDRFAELASKLRVSLVLLKQRALQFWNALRVHPYFVLLLIAISIYGVIFSYFTVLKHNVFLSSGWDLGVFDQALYTTIHDGKFLYYTPDLFLSPSGCYFAQHVSPILFLLLPFYAINSSAVTLLVLKSFILACGAFPLYFLAKELLESAKAGFIAAFIYLLYVPLQGANWFDFQPQIFLPLMFFSMFYFAFKSKWELYFVTVVLASMIEEHIFILVFLTAAYLLITSKVRPFWQSLKSLRKMNRNLASVITMIFSISYFFVTSLIKNSFPINPQFTDIYKALSVFSVLGVKGDPLLFPFYALFNPPNAFAALFYDFPIKFLYLILLFGPLLFLSLKSKVFLITLPFLGLYLFSNYNAYYSVGSHYPLYILAFIFVAALMVLKRYQNATRKSILRTLLIVSMIFTISASPLSPLSASFLKEGLLWYPVGSLEANEQKSSLADLVAVIPQNASILTQNNLFPHVSNRPNAYVIPLSYVNNDTTYIRSLINNSEYVLLDLSWDSDENSDFVLNEIISNNSYGAYALARNAILFKRGFNDEPLFLQYTEYRVLSAYRDLVTANFSQPVSDSSAVSERVVLCPKNTDGCFVYGPRNYLLPGSYEVVFTVKVIGYNSSHVGRCDITNSSGNSYISKRDIFGFELKSNTWMNFTLAFTSTKLLPNVEFRVSSSGTANMYVDRVIVKRTSSNATSDFGVRTFGPGDLPLANGYVSNEGFLISNPNTTSSVFWYGPYMNLSAGRYRATFMLNLSPLPQKADEHVLTLSLSANSGSAVYAKCEVRSSDFLDSDQTLGWEEFTLDLIVREPLQGVEFTGLNPSSNFTIYLAYIKIEQFLPSSESFSIRGGLQVDHGQIVTDASSRSGEVALSRKGLDEGILIYGPYIALESGIYTAVFRIKTNSTEQNAKINFDVASQLGIDIVSIRTVGASDVTDGSWFDVALSFYLRAFVSNIEFRVSSNGLTTLYVDTITVSRDIYQSFSIRGGLQVDHGQIVTDASSRSGEVALSRKGLDEGILIYGPYIALESGIYTAVFRIKTNSTEQNAKINFDVVSQLSTNIIANRTLGASEVTDGSWFEVAFPFSLKELTTNMEFRVFSDGLTDLFVDEVIVMFH